MPVEVLNNYKENFKLYLNLNGRSFMPQTLIDPFHLAISRLILKNLTSHEREKVKKIAEYTRVLSKNNDEVAKHFLNFKSDDSPSLSNKISFAISTFFNFNDFQVKSGKLVKDYVERAKSLSASIK